MLARQWDNCVPKEHAQDQALTALRMEYQERQKNLRVEEFVVNEQVPAEEKVKAEAPARHPSSILAFQPWQWVAYQ